MMASALTPASSEGVPRRHEVRLTNDPQFWLAVNGALAFHKVRSNRTWTVSDLVGPALQALLGKTGRYAAQMLSEFSIRDADRMGVVYFDNSTMELADDVALHLLATNDRRKTARDHRRRVFWNSARPVVLVALYTYGLACRTQLVSVYGKASAVEDILNDTLPKTSQNDS